MEDRIILSKFGLDYESLEKYEIGSLTGRPWTHIKNMFGKGFDRIEFEITSDTPKKARMNVLSTEYDFSSSGNTFMHIFNGLFLLGIITDKKIDEYIMARGVYAPVLKDHSTLEEYLNSKVCANNIMDNYQRNINFMRKSVLAAFYKMKFTADPKYTVNKWGAETFYFNHKNYSNYFKGLFGYYQIAFSQLESEARVKQGEQVNKSEDIVLVLGKEKLKLSDMTINVINDYIKENAGIGGSIQIREDIVEELDVDDIFEKNAIESIPSNLGYDISINGRKYIFKECQKTELSFEVSKPEKKLIKDALTNIFQFWVNEASEVVKSKNIKTYDIEESYRNPKEFTYQLRKKIYEKNW